jgi:hypothetical protein
MIPKDFNPNPPPRKPPLIVDPAEFAALRTLVTAILAMIASQRERSQVGAGQAWINDVSAVCQDAILNGTIDLGSGDADAFKRETMEHVNNILKSVTLPNDRGSSDN